ncbi:anti-sigma-factor antagonist [Paramagnetospirillum caucaseum]|uniref:Anti-sigma-factor antagonist n=1 Tax=Paramagnetospirillum caucaseum TaxID=1244869 RepID=M3AFG7_9PROT|nr:STAS domain-containing protein [Paramagnetospirillum caucaseum]EME71573.1 anti-sigma-factor antagonist [Paramagnetospirillum caucaseum]
MEHEFESRDGGLTIKVSGRMTHKDHKAFRDILSHIGNAGTARVRFDLSRVEFMDSSALGMLLIVRDAAVQQSRDVILKGATGQVENLMKVAKLHKYFTVE